MQFFLLILVNFGLQAFVSEYAVTGKDAGTGSLLASLAEAAFLIGLEKNRFLFLSTFLFPGLLRKNLMMLSFFVAVTLWKWQAMHRSLSTQTIDGIYLSLSLCFFSRSYNYSGNKQSQILEMVSGGTRMQ